MPLTDTGRKLLTEIERIETRSLQWGFINGSLSSQDILNIAESALQYTTNQERSQIIKELLDQMAVVEVVSSPGQGPVRYRTRFAEGVRLLSSLTQQFHWKHWTVASRLVNDFRIDVRPRLYPRRDVNVASVERELREAWGAACEPDVRAVRSLIPGDGDGKSIAKFQLDAIGRIAKPGTSGERGFVISAGTGTGKTLAFYIPAFISLLRRKESDFQARKLPSVFALCVYPRVELLKDQFTEAYRLARNLDGECEMRGIKPILMGSLYSDTPLEARYVEQQWEAWGDGSVCPFLLCPERECNGRMIWRRADIRRGNEVLECEHHGRGGAGCPGKTPMGTIALTRKAMQLRSPDVVFTTTELMNQRISDPGMRSIIGIHKDAERSARFVLFDEAHTYEGTTGANTALFFRRWKRAARVGTVTVVGLSATLRKATEFFGDFTGLNWAEIEEIAPADGDFEEGSSQYQLVLRGDAGTRTSLLSTTIQVSFLLPRLLDPGTLTSAPKDFGSRVFVFTDDLDDTNRLLDYTRDAEGYDARGRRTARPTLASLRDTRHSHSPPSGARNEAGQHWWLPEGLGWNLSTPLRITRTSSYDKGVDASSDIVVATASLEVGFNDPRVGAIIQHKAPKTNSAFIQRRGRAGRQRTMRPWMVTVLSDYGLDRLAFQSYERLFDPVIDPIKLPIRNRYTLKAQAAHAFIDWLIEEMPDHPNWWLRVLKGPSTDAGEQRAQESLAGLISKVLDNDGPERRRYVLYLQQALCIGEKDVEELLYSAPRSILLEVLPTLSRRLRTRWQIHSVGTPVDGAATFDHDPNPNRNFRQALPEFIPRTLFSELQLPEVRVELPGRPNSRTGADGVDTDVRAEGMAAAFAINTWIPGSVTRRFGEQSADISHWIAVDCDAVRQLDGQAYEFDVTQATSGREFIADVPINVGDDFVMAQCFRPIAIAPSLVPPGIDIRSRGFNTWSSAFEPSPGATSIAIAPFERRWARFITSMEYALHTLGSPMLVRRYVHQSETTVWTASHEELPFVTRFVAGTGADKRPAALGFEMEVDAVTAWLAIPSPLELVERAKATDELGAWRVAYWRDGVQHDTRLMPHANKFQRGWLEQVYLGALVRVSARNDVTIEQASGLLSTGSESATFSEVIRAIFSIGDVAQDVDGAPDVTVPGSTVNRNATFLEDLLRRDEVLAGLASNAQRLWSEPDEALGTWLRERLHETLGEVLLAGCVSLATNEAGRDSLLLDLALRPGNAERAGSEVPIADSAAHASSPYQLVPVVISEGSLGGMDVLAAVARQASRYPSALPSALDAACAPSDLEVVATDLHLFLRLAVGDGEIRAAVSGLRVARGHDEFERARQRLGELLATRGVPLSPSLLSALNHRMLRAGTDAVSDELLLAVADGWESANKRIGIRLPLRVYAYIAASGGPLAPRLRELVARFTGADPEPEMLASVLVGLLWVPAEEVRAQALYSPRTYRTPGFTDPALVRELLGRRAATEVTASPGHPWEETAIQELHETRRVRIAASSSDAAELARTIAKLLSHPIDFGFHSLFPYVDGAGRTSGGVWFSLAIREEQ